MRVVDARTHRTVSRLTTPADAVIGGVRFWPDGRTVAVTILTDETSTPAGARFSTATMFRFDARTGRRTGSVRVKHGGLLSPPPWQAWPKTPVIMTSDGRRLVVGDHRSVGIGVGHQQGPAAAFELTGLPGALHAPPVVLDQVEVIAPRRQALGDPRQGKPPIAFLKPRDAHLVALAVAHSHQLEA